MKKLVILLPILLLALAGCSDNMEAMSEAHTLFKEKKADGYIVTEEYNGKTTVLDFNSETDYTISYKAEGLEYTAFCGNPEEATLKKVGSPDRTDADLVDFCEEMYNMVLDDLSITIEDELNYNSSFDIEYETTDDGYVASGVYDDDTPYKLTLTETEAIFENDEGKISMELKSK